MIDRKKIELIRAQGLRPQAVACIVNENKILLLYKEKYNLWQLPQGGIKIGETIESALMREMSEELGENFASCLSGELDVIQEDKVVFPKARIADRKLILSNGQEIDMIGKYYFFCALKASRQGVNAEETEFDDYAWLEYKKALDIANKIYQPGKKRITLAVLTCLMKKSYIE